jgi:hypothetical protein
MGHGGASGNHHTKGRAHNADYNIRCNCPRTSMPLIPCRAQICLNRYEKPIITLEDMAMLIQCTVASKEDIKEVKERITGVNT